MDIFLIAFGTIFILVWLWLTILGIIVVNYDSTLDSFQRNAQIVIAVVFPFFGAALILHLVNQHSPDVIPKKWIPWPLRSLIFGKPRPRNKIRDSNENSGIDLAISHSQHSHTDGGGGGD